MAAQRCISPDLTVRQVIATWPACAQVLERFPLARWDGRWSLQQLSAFARDCGVDEQDLLRRLAAVARVEIARSAARSQRDGSPMPIIFTALAAGLTVGAGWGVILLLRIAFGATYSAADPASVHVHGVAQLWGWMSLFIFAVATHLLRQNSKHHPPRWLHYLAAGAVVAALLAFFAGLVPGITRHLPAIDVLASALLVIATLCFVVSVLWTLYGRGQKPLLWHRFVLAMVAWLMIWAGCDLALRIRYEGAPVLPDEARSLLILLPVLGFATNAIYGFGIRLIPGFLNIGRLRPRCFSATLVLHNTGLCLLVAPWRPGQILGSAAMLAGAGVYLVGIDLLRSKPSRPIYGVDRLGDWLIRIAFAWLVLSLGMILLQQLLPALPHAFSGAWRHALTVGFITTMILGVGQRIVPIFIKQPLASLVMMRISGVLIVLGNAGRVGLELATMGGWPATFRAMGTTGLLELTAIALFGLNLALTVRLRRRVYGAADPLTAGTRVAEAVNARPDLQSRLVQAGITMFDDAPFIAPSMTIGALALASNRTPDQLLSELR